MKRPPAAPRPSNLKEIVEQLGGVPLARIRVDPPPGAATGADALRVLESGEACLCELVDGVRVEKVLSTREALLAGLVLYHLYAFVRPRKLGKVLPPDGAVRLMPGLVRIPDVSFVSWARLPQGIPKRRFASLAPDLAVEVISEGNTRGEMSRKLRDYFLAGVTRVWFIYPETETAVEFTAPDRRRRIARTGTLIGRDVLDGFLLPLADLFEEADEAPPE